MQDRIDLRDYVDMGGISLPDLSAWEICAQASLLIGAAMGALPRGYHLPRPDVAVHESATIEEGAVLKGHCFIGPRCFVAAHAYLRGGVWLGERVTVGPAVEIKSSMIGPGTVVAHFNFIGDAIVGQEVNFEAGAILANHRNEWDGPEIVVINGLQTIRTGVSKFGGLIGDRCRIGANAVLAPGTLLARGTIVPRLGLIDQAAGQVAR